MQKEHKFAFKNLAMKTYARDLWWAEFVFCFLGKSPKLIRKQKIGVLKFCRRCWTARI